MTTDIGKGQLMDIKSRLIHPETRFAAQGTELANPICLSTTFRRDDDGSYPAGYSYARSGNPNRDTLEAGLTHLEGGLGTVAFASGTAATMAVFQTLASGDHVLVADDCYWGTRAHLEVIFLRWGLQYEFVDMLDRGVIAKALRKNTKLLWIETPSNPMMRVTDIKEIVGLAHGHGALVVADNTLATGFLQQPTSFGSDLVVLSTTKYIGGHSDAIGGAVVVKDSSILLSALRKIQHHGGAIPSPFDCWLIHRGLSTLPARLTIQSQNAEALARYLQKLKYVESVHYPALEVHPQYHLHKSQMKGGGGLLSFQVRGSKNDALQMLARLRMVNRATSLGGIETTAEHRASMEGIGTKTPDNLIRVSVGLEAIDDLLNDFNNAFGVK